MGIPSRIGTVQAIGLAVIAAAAVSCAGCENRGQNEPSGQDFADFRAKPSSPTPSPPSPSANQNPPLPTTTHDSGAQMVAARLSKCPANQLSISLAANKQAKSDAFAVKDSLAWPLSTRQLVRTATETQAQPQLVASRRAGANSSWSHSI